MKNFYHAIRSKLTGRNTQNTPPEVVTAQMNEVRPLPLGRAEFDVWASRIISGSVLEAAVDSQRFALANMLLHLGPTESHKPDAFFIHSLRKFAINQVADDVRKQLHEEAKARTAAEEAAAVEVPVASVALVSAK